MVTLKVTNFRTRRSISNEATLQGQGLTQAMRLEMPAKPQP